VPPPSRAQSRSSARRALSPKAMAQNALAGRSLQALGQQRRSQGETQSLGDDFKKHLVKDENGFSELVSSVTKDIEDGFKSMHSFDPHTAAAARSPKHQLSTSPRRTKGGEKTEAEEERDRRFELYKMVRRIEPEEIPPLDRSCLDGNLKIDCEQPLVKYNASREALERCGPQAKLDRTTKFCAVRNQKELSANLMRTALMSHTAGHWLTLLHKKQAQGQDAIERQKTSAKRALKGREALPREWLAYLAAGAFLNQAREALVVAKMSPEERIQHFQVLQRRTASKATAEDDASAKRVQRFGDVLRAKLHILRRRKNARMIFSVMSHWQVGGTTLMLLKDFGYRIRKLQRWWRKCAQRIGEQRLALSRRWRKLEKEDLHHRFPMCDSFKIEEESISEAVRVEFIRNEVRARRYLVLPQIALWEADVAKWRKAMEEWACTRAAHRALGVLDTENMEVAAKKNSTVFAWPESRPSHLPPRHPNHQARTCQCPEDCPGRRGDEQMMMMICRCREFREGGGGWRTISERGHEKKSSKKKGSQRANKKGGSSSPYGRLASDQELQQYGVHLESLPCLSRGHDEVL